MFSAFREHAVAFPTSLSKNVDSSGIEPGTICNISSNQGLLGRLFAAIRLSVQFKLSWHQRKKKYARVHPVLVLHISCHMSTHRRCDNHYLKSFKHVSTN